MYYTIHIGEGNIMNDPPNKPTDIPETTLSDTERVELIANLVLDILSEEVQQLEEVPCKTS